MVGLWGEGSRNRTVWTATLLASTMLTGVSATFAAEAAAPAGDNTIGEIIVTAQKREESLQKVPASVQALGTQQLQQLHVQNFNDYVKFLPSVSFQTTAPGQTNVYMRGVAADNQSNHSGSQPSVGTYLDEQPITTIGGALDVHVYDIARVEALSGPQGTLYGASSEAGTIKIVTNKPELGKFSAAYDVEANQVDHGGVGGSAEGYVNVPLGDKMAIRLVGWDEHDAGYIDNVYGTRNFVSTGITVNNAAYIKKNYNKTDIYGGRAALKIELNQNWTVTPTIIAQDEHNTGIFGYDPSVGDLKVQHFRPEGQHDRWYQAALTVQGKIGDYDLVYSGGHMDRRLSSQSDYTDYSYLYDKGFGYAAYFMNNAHHNIDPTQWIIGNDHFTKESHEIRISSPANRPVHFVMGAFYQDQRHFIIQNYLVNDLSTGPSGLSVTGWPGTLWLTDQLRVDRDFAFFNETTFDLTDKLSVTGGIRFYKSVNQLEGFYGFSANFSSHTGEAKCEGRPPIIAGSPCTNLNKTIRDNGETHKINITYKLDSDKLIYATYSTGFRPGGVNRNGSLPPYDPDYLSNYEIGWKTSWLDKSLNFNGALFWEDWKNFQFSYLGLNSLTVIANAGNARILGAESQVSWRATHDLTISGSASYTNAELQENFCGGQTCSATNPIQAPKGTQLPVTPKFKANVTARYQFDLASFRAHLQGSVVAQTSSWSDLLTQAPIPPTPSIYAPVRSALGKQQGYATADFSGGVERDNWSLELSILNAFDTRAQMYRYAECTIQICGQEPYIVPNRPRTISIRFGQKF
ncbi:MAG: TonB-dependent receptor [Caulobacteraceae bacterium]|nr:TonB-dependent receptor [Caulobacteraceae bacterium]